MFLNCLDGLGKLFKTDIEPPNVLLVTGPPGSMKTSFCYALMSGYAKRTDAIGLYTTLEEPARSQQRSLKSMGVKLSPNVQISDFTDLREVDRMVGVDDQTNYLEFIEKLLAHHKQAHGRRFRAFALDSLGALYSLMEDVSHMRKKMFYFFKMLREYDLFSLVVMEREVGDRNHQLGNEGFLVDGIFHLGLDRRDGRLTRYLQVEKMRASRHSVEKHAIEVRKGGIAVLGPIVEAAG